MDVKDAVDELVPSHLKPINQAACLTAARQFISEEACSDPASVVIKHRLLLRKAVCNGSVGVLGLPSYE